jgi:RecA-family ATPase
MHITEKARRYLDRMPPAVSGQNGHNQTFRVACVLIQGFNLSIDEARPLMAEYSSRCQPPWTERDIEHKMLDADRTPDPKGRGYLTKGIRHVYRGTQQPPTAITLAAPKSPAQSQPGPKRYGTNTEIELPAPITDGTRQLMLAAFDANEGIRICQARSNEDGREVPKDAGIVLTREEWLAKLEATGGNPNGFMSTTAKNGIFISINPLKVGGSRDADVTAYRHCLLEFDDISIQEQWNLITQSQIPATCVIHSGGRSLHAWVKVDAKDRPEYDERVKTLYKHFAEYKPDEKNKNPSRFSRLPNCVRFDKRQELLALNTGSESFSAWLIEQDLDQIGQEVTIESLLEFDPEKDPNSLFLGGRWLCRGASCFWIAQTGIGKSSLAMQMAIMWALERPVFGVAPAKPLKSLIIQSENDTGDLAEMFQGVWLGNKLPGGEDATAIQNVKSRLKIRTIDTLTGRKFLDALRRLIDKDKPDLVWVDPILAFIGDDISKQSVCSAFFREGIQPIAKATGCTFMFCHHTGKPPKEQKQKTSKRDSSYSGIGSSDIPNWTRADVIITSFDDDIYEIEFGKRGKRAGARDTNQQATTKIYARHSKHGICWEQVDAPSPEEQQKAKSKYKLKTRPASDFDYEGFLETITGEYFSVAQLVERVRKFSGCGERTAYGKIIPELKTRMKMDPETKSYSS